MDAAHAVADAVATEIENVTEALSGGVNATVNGTNSTDANATGSFESHIMFGCTDSRLPLGYAMCSHYPWFDLHLS